MRGRISSLATLAAYGASQLPRVAWYAAHAYAMRRLSTAQAGASRRPRARTNAPVPDQMRLWADLVALLRRDLANVENGIYPLPADHDGSLTALINRSKLFFEDLPAIHRRRESGAHSEVLTQETREAAPLFPAKFPFPDRRLADRGLREALRHAGRSAVQGRCERDAAAGPAGTA